MPEASDTVLAEQGLRALVKVIVIAILDTRPGSQEVARGEKKSRS